VDLNDGPIVLRAQASSITDVPMDSTRLLLVRPGQAPLAILDTHDLSKLGIKAGDEIRIEEGDTAAVGVREEVQSTPSASARPRQSVWASGLFEGSMLVRSDGSTTQPEALEDSMVVGIYFSAHWCPPCRMFTPALAEAYRSIRSANKKFEIVFVSSDHNEAGFDEYLRSMPWLALPFAERSIKNKLSGMFGVSGIPCLVLLDGARGSLITRDGRQVIMQDRFGTNFPWSTGGHSSSQPPPQPQGAGAAQKITVTDLSKILQNVTTKGSKSSAEIEREKGMQEMEARIASGSRHVLIYEDKAIQAQALKEIPVDEIRRLAVEEPMNLGPNDSVVRHLLRWFKHRCFKWVNNAPCDHCGSSSTKNAGADRPNVSEQAHGAGVVELYHCNDCNKTTRFPRYNHPGKLMETKRGRCGEWANAFTLCCIAMGFEARHVVDWTDHVWTEVFSEDQQRWIHCDPCEDSWDSPLLYSEGWGKKLSYVIAFSKDEVVDVTCRYTRQWDECRTRRSKCPELWLAEYIQTIKLSKLSQMPPQRQNVLRQRWEKEVKELEPRNYVKPSEPTEPALPGRTTGSLEWRAARGELGNGEPVSDVAHAAGEEVGGVRRSETHGGQHADSKPFDDSSFLGAKINEVKLRGISVKAEQGPTGVVCGIRAHYLHCKDDTCSLLDAPEHFGSSGSSQAEVKRISLDEDEYISEVKGRAGALLDAIEFSISKRGTKSVRVERFGGGGGSEFRMEAPESHEIIGFHGAVNGHLHSIGVIFRRSHAKEEKREEGKREEQGSGAKGGAMSEEEEAKLRLQQLIRENFFAIQQEGKITNPNEIAAIAIERARKKLSEMKTSQA